MGDIGYFFGKKNSMAAGWLSHAVFSTGNRDYGGRYGVTEKMRVQQL